MTKLESALKLAKAGFVVFPLVPNGKRPLIENWRNLATTEESVVRQWWADRPDANIGIQTDQLLVIDIDPRKGGRDTMLALGMVQAFPQTRAVTTPSTGAHFYYRLPEHTVVRGGVDVLGPGVDVRSYGGLVAAPGSTINGKSYIGHDLPMAEAPPWLIEQCKKPRQRSDASAKRVVEEDDTACEMAWRWLVDHAPSANEGNRDDTGFKVAARLFDFGVSGGSCRELLAEWNQTHCHPPLAGEDLDRLVHSGAHNRDNAIGSRHPAAPGFEAVEIEERPAGLKNPPNAQSDLANTTNLKPFLTIPASVAADRALTNPARPLIKGLLDRLSLSVFYGAPGSGKSFLAIEIAYHIAKGEMWAGMKATQGAVVYVAAEGGEGVFARLAALKNHYGPLEECHLHVLTAPVDLLHSPKDAEAIITETHRLEEAHGIKVELVIIDTVARALAGGDENSGQDMGALIQKLDRIRTSSSCHVMGIHHTGKDESKGARGHSSLLGAVDTQVEIKNGTLKVKKQRDMTKETVIRFRLKTIRIGLDQDGDEVTSCYVETETKDDKFLPGLTPTIDKLWRVIYDKNKSNPQHFDVHMVKTWFDSAFDSKIKRPALLYQLSELSESCRIAKIDEGIWQITPHNQRDGYLPTIQSQTCQKAVKSTKSKAGVPVKKSPLP